MGAAPDDSQARTGPGSRGLGLLVRSAQRVEGPQGFGLLAGGDLFSQKPTRHGAVGQPPHAMSAGHIHPARDFADQGAAIWGDRARTDPDVAAFGPAHTLE